MSFGFPKGPPTWKNAPEDVEAVVRIGPNSCVTAPGRWRPAGGGQLGPAVGLRQDGDPGDGSCKDTKEMLLSLEAKSIPHSDRCETCRDTFDMRT